MIARPLASMEIGVYASPRYLARKGEPISPAQLVEHDCLTSKEMGAGAHWSFDHRHSGHPCTIHVKGVLHSNQVEVLVDAAAHGAGIVMLPAFIAQEAVLTGRLRRILQDWRVAPQALHLAYNSRRNQPMSVRKLIEHLVEHLGAKQDVESAQTRRLHYDEGTSSTTLLVEPAAAWRAPQALGAEGLASAGCSAGPRRQGLPECTLKRCHAWPQPQRKALFSGTCEGLSRPWRSQPLMKASRSALMTSACVVGMPCGKPL